MHASTDMEKAFILIGEGSNGKSTYLKLVDRLLGKRMYRIYPYRT